MRKLRKGQADNTTLIYIGVGVAALLVVGLLVWLLIPKSNLMEIRIGKVVIAQVPKSAIIEWKNTAVTKQVEEVYDEYGYVPVFEGRSMINYDSARADAMGKLGQFLQAKVKRFEELAKAALANTLEQTAQEGQQVNAQKLETEVYKMVQQIHTQVQINGVVDLVKYRLGNEYRFIIFYNPNMAFKMLADQMNTFETLAKRYGAQSKALFEAVNEALKEAYKGTPMEEQ